MMCRTDSMYINIFLKAFLQNKSLRQQSELSLGKNVVLFILF